MSDDTPYNRCMTWMHKRKSEIECSGYGRNRVSVQDAITQHEKISQEIQDYKTTVDSTLKTLTSQDATENIEKQYADLQELCDKKKNCLQTMLEITELQHHVSNLSMRFDTKASSFVHHTDPGQSEGFGRLMGFTAPSSQDCDFAVRDNWNWIIKVLQCTDIHLNNAAQYHQFFHNIDESEVWLKDDLSRIEAMFDVENIGGDYDNAKALLREIEELTTCLRQWETRIQLAGVKASQVVPIHKRIKPTEKPLPARALADYQTTEIHIRDGEDILILNNENSEMWTVRTCRGQEAEVPSVICLIPGPDDAAVDKASLMRLRLLASWTKMLKRIGKRLICFMLMVFKPEYESEQIQTMKTIPPMDKRDLLRILEFIESSLQPQWANHEGFVNLQERLLSLRLILEEDIDKTPDAQTAEALVVQIRMLEELMSKYKDLWGNWEGYKVASETCRLPELMLIVDKWEQLKYVSTDYLSKFWQTDLGFTDKERSLGDLKQYVGDGVDFGGESLSTEEMITSEHATNISHTPQRLISTSQTTSGIARDASLDQTDDIFTKETVERVESSVVNSGQFGTAEGGSRVTTRVGLSSTGSDYGSGGSGGQETRTTVTETTVTGGRRNPRLSSQVSYGSKSGESFDEIVEEFASSNAAVSQLSPSAHLSDAHLGFATETKTAETEQIFSSVQEEKKTFFIRSVIDQRTGERISMQQAIVEGVIHPETGNFVNLETGESMPIPEAMSKGFIEVSFASTQRGQEKKSTIGIITVKTTREKQRPYNVKFVTNTNTGKKVSYQEAINNRLVDENQGTYKNLKTNSTMMITDAAKDGLVELEYEGDVPEPEEVSKKYAVRAVVDRRHKKIITFQAAVSRGIINKESGAFLDTLTGESMYVGDAIIRGFLKARLIGNTDTLNIDPENQMVIDKTETIRKKLLRPLKVISAFKKASAFAKLASK